MSKPGTLLRNWRTKHNLGPAEAAARVDVERQTWWRWENGHSFVALANLPKVSDVTGIPKQKLRPDLAQAVRA